jgi:hypothetical protein
MWSRADLDKLNRGIPFPVVVDWDKRPSPLKYGHVNSLLAVICALQDQQASFVDAEGAAINTLAIAPAKRHLTDQHKKRFSIVGHNTTHPMLIACVGKLQIEIYFNHHLFVQTKTTPTQYFPSASVILRTRNFLRWDLVPSPGSWGSDIISLSYDWPRTFILEAAATGLASRVRHNFRGYRLAPVQYKLFLSRRQLPRAEQKRLENNGFTTVIISEQLEGCYPVLTRELARYIQDQSLRL